MAKLLYQGHGSFRITTDKNIVIYVDPYAGKGYEVPADIILVTHQHRDHNQINLVTKKMNYTIIQNQDVLQGGQYKNLTVNNVAIQAVPAYNSNHDRRESVGYILTFDGIKLYAAGDTSTTKEMTEYHKLNLDYVLLPIDGVYNMNTEEATACANLIDAKYAIPIHMKPGALFDIQVAEKFTAINRLILEAGMEIVL
jgi:L-ascorbate metabolism protein UlaG (beta-lactamase superfamily)